MHWVVTEKPWDFVREATTEQQSRGIFCLIILKVVTQILVWDEFMYHGQQKEKTLSLYFDIFAINWGFSPGLYDMHYTVYKNSPTERFENKEEEGPTS